MPNIESRLGARRELPIRNQVEVAPPRLRLFLKRYYVEKYGVVNGYKRLAEAAGELPEDVSSSDWAEPRLQDLVEGMNWIDVYEVLESAVCGIRGQDEEINRVLAREGVAYEVVDGKFVPFDPEMRYLGLDLSNPVDDLDQEFSQVRVQFQRALALLNGIPADYPGAIREALNSVEGVLRIRADDRNLCFGDGLNRFLGSKPTRKLISESLKKLYGYSTQVPGARKSEYEPSEVEFPEAAFAVRASGAAVAMLIAEHRVGNASADPTTSLVL